MEFTMFGYTVKIEKRNELPVTLFGRRLLARRIQLAVFLKKLKFYKFRVYNTGTGIDRIKALRRIKPGTSLVDAKEWVELAFTGNGAGPVA